MKYSKRMVLVPEEFMDMMERKENIQTAPMTKSMIRLDKEMDGILEDGKKATDDKISQYHQDLQRFLEIQEKKKQYIPTVKIHEEKTPRPTSQEDDTSNEESHEPGVVEKRHLSDDEILESVPKNSRTLARSMINRLKANREHISWNDKGVTTINGHPVPGSNIIDLVNDQLRSRKDFDPKGWELFTESLDKINMPKYLMRNEKRRSHIAQLQEKRTPLPAKTNNEFNFPPTPPSTPRSIESPVFRKRKIKRFSDNWIPY